MSGTPKLRARIAKTAVYLPPKIETAAELAAKIGVTEEWIVQRTNVRERRISEDEDMAVFAARAASQVLEGQEKPDLILNASGVARQVLPDSSVFIQQALGLTGIPSHSVHATCLSFVVALHTAYTFVHAGVYRRILVVSADQGSRGRNFKEAESSALFGDGAAAALVEAVPEDDPHGSGILGFQMGTWPEGAHLTEVRGGGSFRHPHDPRTTYDDNYFTMDGPGVYKMARRRIAVILRRVFDESGIEREDLDLVVPHQASGPGVQMVRRYGMSMDKTVNIVETTGNCVAASIPMAIATADAEGRLKRGDEVLLVGTGAGLSVAAMVLRW